MTKQEYNNFCREMRQGAAESDTDYNGCWDLVYDCIECPGIDPEMDTAVEYLKSIGVKDVLGRLADDISC